MIVREIAIAVTDVSQVGEARRQVRQVATDAEFDESDRETAALITTELATNLARHAQSGEILMRCVDGADSRWLEIMSVDRGPGMSNIERCLEDGFSTAGTAGQGLGATRRLSTEFDIHSNQPAGTIVLARVNPKANGTSSKYFRWGVVSRPMHSEVLCGDAWRIVQDSEKLAIIVVDGLGHGPLAADAANEAIAAFDHEPFAPLTAIVQRADAKMRGTRGGAVAIAHIDVRAKSMKYVGVGNIAGHLRLNGDDKGRGLMSHNGTVGVQARKIQEIDYPLPERGLLVMHSDGLQSRWSLENYPGLVRQHPAVIAGVLYRDFTRGRDDITVAVVQATAVGSN
jgi:anti-sigma regulatory factor (Ser/Thr protein kinase)